MKKIKIFVCFLFFSSCISNNNRTPQKEEEGAMPELPYHISLENAIGNIKPAELSEVGSSITYIPLETVSESLLKEIRRVIVTDSYFIVNDALVFDSAGNFLRQIGRKGQGPGEYSMFIGDVFLSFDKNKLYLLVETSKVLEYTIEGKFLNSYKLDSIPCMILPIKDDLFVYYCRNATRNPIGQSLVISDLNNNIQKTYKNYHKRIRKSGIDIFLTFAPFYIYQENIRFKEFGCDTLFTVTEEDLIPYCILDLGKRKIPVDFSVNNPLRFIEEVGAQEEYPSMYWISKIVEDVDNLYITLSDFKNDLYGFINKKTQVVKVIGDQGFRNDIDGGLPFFPINSHHDSILVGHINAFDLREHVLNSNAAEMKRLYGQKHDDLVKFANSIDDESNPIIVLVKK